MVELVFIPLKIMETSYLDKSDIDTTCLQHNHKPPDIETRNIHGLHLKGYSLPQNIMEDLIFGTRIEITEALGIKRCFKPPVSEDEIKPKTSNTSTNTNSTTNRSSFMSYTSNTYNTTPKCQIINAGPAPIIRFTNIALKKMGYYVGLCSDEIGWFATASEKEEDGKRIIVIDDSYLFEQRVHGATTEITPEGLTVMIMQMLAEDNNDYDKRAGRLFCWGHSHVNMDTTASGQDNDQMKVFEENGIPWMVRIIANKRGSLSIDFYDYKNNVIWSKLPFEVILEESPLLDSVREEYRALGITEEIPVVQNAAVIDTQNTPS